MSVCMCTMYCHTTKLGTQVDQVKRLVKFEGGYMGLIGVEMLFLKIIMSYYEVKYEDEMN